MGQSCGKTYPLSKEVLKDFSKTSGLPLGEVTQQYEDWMKNNPTGKMDRTGFKENMKKVNPQLSKSDLVKISQHVFRVFDTDKDGKIEFVEFMEVYNILTWTDIETVLGKLFDIFDVDRNNSISKREMKNVCADFSSLLKHNKAYSEIFDKLDTDKDEKISKEEFISTILNDKILMDTITSLNVLDVFGLKE